jgi:hypothetical protein
LVNVLLRVICSFGGTGYIVQQFQKYKATVIEAQEWAKGGVSAAVAGTAVASTATTLLGL